jgi:hypothetical protein
MIRCVLVLCVCVAFVLCALPLQYESEFYCPPGYCRQLNRKHARRPMDGGGIQVYECCNTTNALNTTHIHPWGIDAGPIANANKLQWINDKYHETECSKGSECSQQYDRCAENPSHRLSLTAIVTLRRVEHFFSL